MKHHPLCLLLVSLLPYAATGASTNAAALTVPPLETLRQHMDGTLQATRPDRVVFIPRLSESGVSDTGNEHFLVFDGPDGSLMAVWTQSTHEGAPDQHIIFAQSRDEGRTWSAPRLIAGPAQAGQGPMASWAFPLVSRRGRIYVLYSQHVGKVDTFPHTTGQLTGIYSDDPGRTWSSPQSVPFPRTSRDNPDPAFPANCIIWQKPLRLGRDGRYLTGLTRWTSLAVKKNPTKSWMTHDSVVEFIRFENVDDNPEPARLQLTGLAWDQSAITVPCRDHPETSVAQEPSIVKLPDGRLFCVLRTTLGTPYWTLSADQGEHWSTARPLLRRDGGEALPHPLSPCPLFDLGGNAAGSGRYVLFIHNHDGHYQRWGPWDSNFHRRPIYQVAGHFQPGAQQPVWFEAPQFFFDHDGLPLGVPGKQGRVDLALYASMTVRQGQATLWYPDRKFFLLGKVLATGTSAPAGADRPPAASGQTPAAATTPSALPAEAGPPLLWLSLTNAAFAVQGLPWFSQNHHQLMRLPLQAKDTFRPAVWSLAQSPSGGRIRFRTDSQCLWLKLEYPGPPNMANMHAFGQCGVDVYVDGLCLFTATADRESKPGRISEQRCFDFSHEPRQEREITLYLPLYKGVTVHGIGVDSQARFQPAKAFACARPVVFYGTSITQGGAASRPGMSYPALLGRQLNLDYVNLGFSGNGLGEPEVARAVAEIDAACFVLDFGANHKTFAAMKEVYAPFVEIIRAQHPTTPILALTPIYTAREDRSTAFHQDWAQRRSFIEEVVAQRIRAGEAHIQCVPGADLLGRAQADGLVDGSHPNDLGFFWMAQGLAPHLRQVLNLPEPVIEPPAR